MHDLYVPCRKSANSRETQMLVPIVKHLAFVPVAQVRRTRGLCARHRRPAHLPAPYHAAHAHRMPAALWSARPTQLGSLAGLPAKLPSLPACALQAYPALTSAGMRPSHI